MNQSTSLVRTIELELRRDDRGDLIVGEVDRHFPFPIRRIFYILNVPERDKRGFHAHKKTQMVLVCLRGSVLIQLDNGRVKDRFLLHEPHLGLLVEPLIWHSMEEFATDTLLLALVSEGYDESDYIRNYHEFIQLTCS